jgi:putative transposase
MKNVQLMTEGKVLQLQSGPTAESAGKHRDDRTHELEHAGDTTAANSRTLDFSQLSEFLVATSRFRSRAELELEVIALRHQLAVLRRQRPGRPWLSAFDRMLWIWLYRVWPRCLNIMVLVKPATLVRWHRQGFQFYWRRRSRSGRPSVGREVRHLIRQMNSANPLWGAPRIHGELLKLGIEVSQATVAKYMVRRVGTPSPTWRSFLRNEAIGIAAIDMFVAVSASFRLLYVMIILAHGRRKIMRFDVTQHPTAAWLSQQLIEAFPWETAPSFLLRDRDASYGSVFSKRVAGNGNN